MEALALRRLDGAVVLLKSASDKHRPPTGVRGFIEVRGAPGMEPAVHIAYDLPQMFGRTARHYTIDLAPHEVDRLVASGTTGSFEYEVSGPLDPTPGYH